MSNKKEAIIQMLDVYNLGLEHYKKRDFQNAMGQFQKILDVIPDDGPSKLYIDRCKQYIAEPPPQDWDGVYTMTTK